ncbi:hypothetical protein SUGI_0890550 [Cryptomeria japonica]|nr:hypothetical protein SUGI_0890550 [Cryptomeria japonica]
MESESGRGGGSGIRVCSDAGDADLEEDDANKRGGDAGDVDSDVDDVVDGIPLLCFGPFFLDFWSGVSGYGRGVVFSFQPLAETVSTLTSMLGLGSALSFLLGEVGGGGFYSSGSVVSALEWGGRVGSRRFLVSSGTLECSFRLGVFWAWKVFSSNQPHSFPLFLWFYVGENLFTGLASVAYLQSQLTILLLLRLSFRGGVLSMFSNSASDPLEGWGCLIVHMILKRFTFCFVAFFYSLIEVEDCLLSGSLGGFSGLWFLYHQRLLEVTLFSIEVEMGRWG